MILETIIAILTSSLATAIPLLYLFIKYPEKVEKWVSILSRGAAYFSERAAKTYMSTHIQSSIDESRKGFGRLGQEILPYGVNIRWTHKETIDSELKENKIVVMMRPFDSQSRNFAHVVSVYVSMGLLPRARRYIENVLMKAVDCTISKSMLEKDSTALEYYLSDVGKDMPDDLKTAVRKTDDIHSKGFLTRILLPEFQRFSILYPREPDRTQYEESSAFMTKIYDVATKVGGVDISPEHRGSIIKASVVLVGKPEKLLLTGIERHFDYVRTVLGEGVDHFHVVARKVSIRWARELVQKLTTELPLSLVTEEEYDAMLDGKKTKYYCAYLRTR